MGGGGGDFSTPDSTSLRPPLDRAPVRCLVDFLETRTMLKNYKDIFNGLERALLGERIIFEVTTMSAFHKKDTSWN